MDDDSFVDCPYKGLSVQINFVACLEIGTSTFYGLALEY